MYGIAGNFAAFILAIIVVICLGVLGLLAYSVHLIWLGHPFWAILPGLPGLIISYLVIRSINW